MHWGCGRTKNRTWNQYFEFSTFTRTKSFPVTEFKLSKFATYLTDICKTVDSIKQYCTTVCQENELRGFQPVCRGLKFYRAIAGIKRDKKHRVNRVQPMTVALLKKILKHIDFRVQKQLVIWTATVSGFYMILRKSNLVPLNTGTRHGAQHCEK